MRLPVLLACLASTALVAPAAAQPPAAPPSSTPLPQGVPVPQLVRDVKLPYTEFTLANGLRVIVHTDRQAPVVAVAVWYHIGSKDEPAGRTGFAHLYEHLMFGGSEHSDQSWFAPMQAIGATDLNGTTSFDRTNYFETVPKGALDTALYLESDRMGWLLGAVTQKKLDIQRGVVENEKRQRDNQPGGLLQYQIFQTLFPAGNPYHHTPIGSMADLDQASLEAVKGWFRAHYGPNNAVLVLSGDISPEEARPLVEKYFGPIPAGPATKHPAAPVPTLPAPVAMTFHDEVATTTVSRMWAIPGYSSADAPALDLAAAVLGGLDSSRLDNALVRGARLAVHASADTQELEDVGLFSVDAEVKPGVDPAEVGRALDTLIADFLKTGPSAAELKRAKTVQVAGAIRGLESFNRDAAALAEGAVYANDPDFFRKQLVAEAALTPAQVQAAAHKWLSRPVFAFTLAPGPRGAHQEAATVSAAAPAAKAPPAPAQAEGNGNAAGEAPRGPIPSPGPIADLKFPAIEHATLSNGVPVSFAHVDAGPIVRVGLEFDAGNAADPIGKAGTQAFMVKLLDQGTDRYDANQIAEGTENLGAAITTGANMDRTSLTLTALAPNLAPSLDLLADLARHPAFRPADLQRLRAVQLADIASEEKDPGGIALRVLPPMLYGPRHPYGVPFSGTGYAPVVAALSPADLAAFHDAWLRPEKLHIFVTADSSLSAVLPLLERSFGTWRGQGPAATKDFAVPTPPAAPKIVLIDRPNSPQSLILGGELMPVKGTQDLVPLTEANDVLGGSFLSRLNTDLRETRHWAYGVGGIVEQVREISPYLVYAPVQSDETGPTITALVGDMRNFLNGNGVTPAELKRTISGSILELPGEFQTSAGVLDGMETNARFDRPDNYYDTLASRYRALTAPELDAAAAHAIDPGKLEWVVIGDKAKVLPQLQAIGVPVQVAGATAPAPAPAAGK